MNTGIVYKIVNDVNDKVYIGVTQTSLEERFKKHKVDAFRHNSKIYKAMRDIGIEHFSIIEIDRCSVAELGNKESYYIRLYNSVEDGYNTNYGLGYQQSIQDVKLQNIINDLKSKNSSLIDLQNKYKVQVKYLIDIKHRYNISTDGNGYDSHHSQEKTPIIGISKDIKEIYTFDAIIDALEWYRVNIKDVKQSNFYYFVRYQAMTGKIQHGFYWFYKKDLDAMLLNNSQIVCTVQSDRSNLCKSGLTYRGYDIFTEKKYHKDKTQVKHDSYKQRQVPEDLSIQYPFTKNELQELYPKYTANSIANHVGVQYNTVNKYLKLFGLK